MIAHSEQTPTTIWCIKCHRSLQDSSNCYHSKNKGSIHLNDLTLLNLEQTGYAYDNLYIFRSRFSINYSNALNYNKKLHWNKKTLIRNVKLLKELKEKPYRIGGNHTNLNFLLIYFLLNSFSQLKLTSEEQYQGTTQ